jgi:hypothetical protein
MILEQYITCDSKSELNFVLSSVVHVSSIIQNVVVPCLLGKSFTLPLPLFYSNMNPSLL